MFLTELIREFLFDCKVRELSDLTVHNYEKQLQKFRHFVRENFPDSVISIGRGAFCCCYNLESIVLPKELTKVPDNLLRRDNRLMKVVVPDIELFPFLLPFCLRISFVLRTKFLIAKEMQIEYNVFRN